MAFKKYCKTIKGKNDEFIKIYYIFFSKNTGHLQTHSLTAINNNSYKWEVSNL